MLDDLIAWQALKTMRSQAAKRGVAEQSTSEALT